MNVVQLVLFALVSSLLLVVLRPLRPEMALLLSLAAAAVILLLVLQPLLQVFGLLQDLALRVNVNLRYVATIVKVIGIAYLVEFAAEICRDAGEQAMASKVELAGKVAILLVAIPVVQAIVALLLRMLGEGA